jgi:hypothetical protein
MVTILSRMVLSHDFMTFKVKIGIEELGNDVYLKKKKKKHEISHC